MLVFVILFFTFITSLLETTFIPYPLTLMAIISYGVVAERRLALVAFFSGIILSILSGRILGMDSAFFITVSLVLFMYRRKIVARAVYYLLPFSVIVITIYNYFFLKKFHILTTFYSLLSGLVIFIFVYVLLSKLQTSKKLSY